jgi:hypothetical protein
MRVLAGSENWPRSGQRWKREGEPTRTVLSVRTPLDWDPVVFFRDTRSPYCVRMEEWDEWMWWQSDAKLQPPPRRRMVRLW